MSRRDQTCVLGSCVILTKIEHLHPVNCDQVGQGVAHGQDQVPLQLIASLGVRVADQHYHECTVQGVPPHHDQAPQGDHAHSSNDVHRPEEGLLTFHTYQQIQDGSIRQRSYTITMGEVKNASNVVAETEDLREGIHQVGGVKRREGAQPDPEFRDMVVTVPCTYIHALLANTVTKFVMSMPTRDMFTFPASFSTSTRHLVVCLTMPSQLSGRPVNHHNVILLGGQEQEILLVLEAVDVQVLHQMHCKSNDHQTKVLIELDHQEVIGVVIEGQMLDEGGLGPDSHVVSHYGLRFAEEDGPHCVRIGQVSHLDALQSEGLVASHHQLQISQIQASDIMFLKMRLFYCNPEDGFNNEVVDSEVHINVMHTSQGFGKFAIINAVMFTFWKGTDEISCLSMFW